MVRRIEVSRLTGHEAATFPLGTYSPLKNGSNHTAPYNNIYNTENAGVNEYGKRIRVDSTQDRSVERAPTCPPSPPTRKLNTAQNWRPSSIYCGIKIGEASNPGQGPQKTSIRLQNVRGGGRHKSDILAGHTHDVLLLTEYELVEYAVKDARTTFRDRGKTLLLGASTNITKKDDKIRGRRVAASMVKNIRPILPEFTLDDGIDELRQSGRWLEMQIPIGNGAHHLTIAVYYGIAGASARGAAYELNERLLACATARALAAGDAPYILLMDGNIQIEDSTILTAVLRGSDLIDVAAETTWSQNTTMTYQKGGIETPFPEESGTSAIDHVLANEAGFLTVESLTYDWDYAICHNLDHVPINVGLTDKAFSAVINKYIPVLPIDTDSLCKLTENTKNRLYNAVRNAYKTDLAQLKETSDPTTAHERWSKLAENSLRAWAYMNDEEDDVDSAVIAMMYSDDDLSSHTSGTKPKHTRRGHLRLTRPTPAIAKLVNGSMTAASHTAEALAKTIARAKSFIKLIGGTLSDTAQIAKCHLKRKLLKAIARDPSLVVNKLTSAQDRSVEGAVGANAQGNSASTQDLSDELSYELANGICEEGTKQLGKLIYQNFEVVRKTQP